MFAKVFCYLEENDPKQEWVAVAIFQSRREEPKHLGPYEDLLQSKRVRRIFLDEVAVPANPPLGVGILELLSAPMNRVQYLAPRILRKAKVQLADSELGPMVIQLVEELLLARFPQFDREEVRMRFKLHDIRESKVWKEAHEEGKTETRKALVEKWLAKAMSHRQIGDLLGISIEEVERLAEKP